MSERCEWSDLPADQCAHCGAAPGSRPRFEPTAPTRQTMVVARVVERALEKPLLPSTWAPSNDAGECRCGKPTRDGAWVCDGCQHDFSRTLAGLTALDEELDVTITRQRAAAATDSPRSTETSLTWHEAAANAQRTLHGLLVIWVRFCDEEQVRGPNVVQPIDKIPSLASWLATRVHGLALLDIGPEAVDEITDAAAECHRIIFWKRRNRVYLGPCEETIPADEDHGLDEEPCPGEVYAEEDAPIGYCDLCETGFTVAVKRAKLEAEMDAYLATAADIARLATYLGLDVPRDMVRKRVLYWHRHKVIEQRGTDPAGAPMFRYGEVKSRLYADFSKRAS